MAAAGAIAPLVALVGTPGSDTTDNTAFKPGRVGSFSSDGGPGKADAASKAGRHSDGGGKSKAGSQSRGSGKAAANPGKSVHAAELAMWALANIAADGPDSQLAVLQAGAVQPLLAQLRWCSTQYDAAKSDVASKVGTW